ncbi:MAG: hypothetical protein ACJ8ER_15430 [Allosphingosinicella sp.]
MMGTTKRVALATAFILAGTVGYAAPAAAQATRTWVSGVGDDVNPCSRTAPCKTFAGAISKTAAGGEINCLDPGGFGAVTITKSLVIDCHYTEGGALAGGNGITVNDSASGTPNTAVVTLRGLDIFGVNPPSNGIRFISGASLNVEDCVIRRFNVSGSYGISFQPAGAARLYVSNTTVSDNGLAGAATGGGILINPTGAAGSAQAELVHVRVINNAGLSGVRVETAGNTSPTQTLTTVRWSEMSGNPIGLSAVMAAGQSQATVLMTDSLVNHNAQFGLAAAGTGTATIRVGGTMITGNGTGIFNQGGGAVRSYGTNQTDGNTAPGGFIAGGAVQN